MNNNDTNIATERLKKLGAHLWKGKLHERVDRSSAMPPLMPYENGRVVLYYDFPFREAVHLFKEWIFSSGGVPVLGEFSNPTTVNSAMIFFDLDEHVFKHLFSADLQNVKLFGGKELGHKATGRDIAYNIRCYLKKSKTFF